MNLRLNVKPVRNKVSHHIGFDPLRVCHGYALARERPLGAVRLDFSAQQGVDLQRSWNYEHLNRRSERWDALLASVPFWCSTIPVFI